VNTPKAKSRPSKSLAKTLNTLALGLGLFMFFGIIIFPKTRQSIGIAMGKLLDPLLTAFPLHIVLFLLAAVTALYATLIQKYTMDWKTMQRVQEKMRKFQQELREAQLSNNKGKLKKLEAQQREMMAEQMAMTKQQFKPMLYISIISIPIFMWAYQVIPNPPPDVSLEMTFPFWGTHKLSETIIGGIPYWIYWYFISSLPISQIIRKSLNMRSLGPTTTKTTK